MKEDMLNYNLWNLVIKEILDLRSTEESYYFKTNSNNNKTNYACSENSAAGIHAPLSASWCVTLFSLEHQLVPSALHIKLFLVHTFVTETSIHCFILFRKCEPSDFQSIARLSQKTAHHPNKIALHGLHVFIFLL